jgi:hypothetical protein
MHLLPAEAEHFYKLLYALQFFVKQKLKLLPAVQTEDEYRKLNAQQKLEVRNQVYEHPEVFNEFVAQNPAQLTDDELAIVRSWKQFVKGDFFIERYLKKYSIWIGGGTPARVYGVLGITDSLADMIHSSYLPLRVHSVLLPWKGQIIYDGVFQSYNILFGGGIKGSLREEYMAAKQNGRIIETLEGGKTAQPPVVEKPIKGWQEEVEALQQLVNVFKGQNVPLHGEVFSLLKTVATLTQIVIDPASDRDALWSQFKKVQRALNKVETVLERAER